MGLPAIFCMEDCAIAMHHARFACNQRAVHHIVAGEKVGGGGWSLTQRLKA
jgi:hypothetical protein